MSKTIWIRVMSLLLAVCLLGAMTGCGQSDDAQGGNDQPAIEIDENDGPLVPYEETVTITQVKSHNPNITYIEGESKTDNFVTEFYKEKLNVVWETTWDADPAAYTAKLNLDISSDELPDVFLCNANQLQLLVENEQIMDLTQIYEYYAGDKLKANISEAALSSCTYDGKIFAIPAMTSGESDVSIMWLRTDWMETLGLEAPTTYEELVAYVKAVKDSGIAGNSCGMNFYGPGSQAFATIAQTQGAYFDTWIEKENGEVVYSGVQPEMRNALLKMQEMYKAGLIDEDFAIKGSTEEALIAQGSYGVVFGQYFYGHLLKGSVLTDENAQWRCYPIPKNMNGDIIPKSSLNVGGYYVVRADCEHPEALLKSMNLWMEVWTKDGQYRDWFTDEMLNEHADVYLCGEYALPSFFDVVDNNVNIGVAIRDVYASENPDEKIKEYPFARLTYNLMKDESNFYKFVAGEGWALKHVYLYAEDVYDDYEQFQYNAFNGVLSEDSAFLKTTIDGIMNEAYYNIIMGEDISAFDKMVEQWYEQGGTEVTAEVNEWVKNH